MKIPNMILRSYRELHSWVGIVAGLFLFVAFYAGAITMFEQPIQDWVSQTASLPPAVSLHATPELLEKTFAAHPEARKSYTVYLAPNAAHPERLSWFLPFSHGHVGQVTLAALDEKGALVTAKPQISATAHFINLLHQQVGLPFPHETSLLVTGVVGLLYGVALISGIILFLPKIAENLFAVRLTTSLRRRWLDLHNLLGIFSLPFHLVMALTAVVFAFHDPVFDVQHALFAKSNPPLALSEKIRSSSAQGRLSQKADQTKIKPSFALPLEPEKIVNSLELQAAGFVPEMLNYSQNKEGQLVLRVAGHDSRYGMRGASRGFAEIDPYSGKILSSDYLPGHQSTGFAILTTFFALHFGNFGGNFVRWGYVLLGLGGAFLFYTGNQLWINARRRREIKSGEASSATQFLDCLTAGCVNGCISGISAIFCAAFGLPHGGDYKDITSVYYGVFVLFVILAFCLKTRYRNSILLSLSALITLSIPVMASLYGHKALLSLPNITIELVAVFLGAFLLWAAGKEKKFSGRV
ncbi:PepSY-associated TM helix domain-containing protein [Zymomonas sp.]|uniref:PepSY-associated TM helix domain-containing protein n=1 Tax=Zymomonas sp. TaxID=2068624 RepID=UPI0025CE871E|nr:PepSY-associated TM helix domain-containing protein [Zymomonas sp.]MCA1955818.1 PepSY domain-containing protein [Zymomonas sp.]